MNHPAFKSTNKLEILGNKYGVKVIFIPKYHCELNPIEGLWCHLKQFIRARNDQTFRNMKLLFLESLKNFEDKEIFKKLIRRFWRVVIGYKNGANYGEILKTYFAGKSEAKEKNHLRISNTLL